MYEKEIYVKEIYIYSTIYYTLSMGFQYFLLYIYHSIDYLSYKTQEKLVAYCFYHYATKLINNIMYAV